MIKYLLITSITILYSFFSLGQEPEKWIIVENMPVHKDCVDEENKLEKENCTKRKMKEYIVQNTKYPNDLDKEDYSGVSYVMFLINEDGYVDTSKTKIVEGFPGEKGFLFDKQAIKVINSLPRMIPASNEGEYLRVQYILPVEFNKK